MSTLTYSIPPFVKVSGTLFVLFLGVVTVLAIPRNTEDVQNGPSGTGMAQIFNEAELRAQLAAVDIPPEPWPRSEDYEGLPTAGEVYENVQVLGHLPAEHFDRLMAAITEWVSPEEGCAYCHNLESDNPFAGDDLYTKIVSRRMIQMTMTINSAWDEHVAPSGVTCYTCHAGQAVPANIWFENPLVERPTRMIGDLAQQNQPAVAAAYASLPMDPFTPFLVEDNEIRVYSATALPSGNRTSIKQAEWTYSLMMHMSDSLGVNCTYCHNTQAFESWEQSPPARVTAWHGIRMVRELNNAYLIPLGPEYPAHRLGPLGDAPKANCATCHQGVYQPLWGADVLADYPSLSGPAPGPYGEAETAQATSQ